MKSYIYLILASTLIAACFSSCNKYDSKGNLIKEYNQIQKVKWVLGEWEKKDSLGTLKEVWKIQDDSTYTGTCYYIQNEKDTIHKEHLELIQSKEHLIYSTAVVGENNDEPVSFQMTKDSDSLLVFENLKHNYPQKIEYYLKKDNSLLAIVSGKINGKISTKNYPLIKKQ